MTEHAMQRPLAYSPDIEQPKPDEAEAIQGIIDAMTRQSEIVAGRQEHAVRASHAKSTGLVIGKLTVASGLQPELAQGLFAAPGSFDVAVRFAQGPGENLPDKISTHRGMAIKVFGVGGEKIEGHTGDTQDFVLATGPVFPSGTAQQFLKDEKQILAATKLPEGVSSMMKSAVSGIAQAVTSATGGGSPKADFFGHLPTHPLSDAYYSQAPIRFGEHVAKLAAFPTVPELQALETKARRRRRSRRVSARRRELFRQSRRHLRAAGPALDRRRQPADRGHVGGMAGSGKPLRDRGDPRAAAAGGL